MKQVFTNRNNFFQLLFHYNLEVYEFITRVNIIDSLQKGFEMKALCLDYKKRLAIFFVEKIYFF